MIYFIKNPFFGSIPSIDELMVLNPPRRIPTTGYNVGRDGNWCPSCRANGKFSWVEGWAPICHSCSCPITKQNTNKRS